MFLPQETAATFWSINKRIPSYLPAAGLHTSGRIYIYLEYEAERRDNFKINKEYLDLIEILKHMYR